MDKRILEKRYLLSVVIPVFDTEQYLERCMKSLFGQTYPNLEILIVDDCSTGNVKELAAKYMQQDHRVRLLSHETNKGLFQARLTGAQAACGDFLAFLDSDDYVSADYYHTLLDAAVRQEADIAIGRTVQESAEGRREIRNLHEACFRFDRLAGEDIRRAFFAQKGLCFAWHTVWNKLYRKTLWDRCAPYYMEGMDAHVVMTEDIAFSTVLFYFADCVTAVPNDAYFYCQNKAASTDNSRMTFARFEKNVRDMHTVFDFCEAFLKQVHAKEEYCVDFHAFRMYYARLWRTISAGRFLGQEQEKRQKLLEHFCPEEINRAVRDDYFFDSVSTPWNGELEYRKEQIAASGCEYVSFDIFDTLVNRPFYQPEHLFTLLNREWESRVDSCMDFASMRGMAERLARSKCSRQHPKWEDVTLEEIYEIMAEDFGVSRETAAAMMHKEQELEIRFCSVRNAGRELYETALLAGKKVLLVSDMYLDENTIKTILARGGYTEYHSLYVSSKWRLTKYTGNLFQHVKKSLHLSGTDHPYHIGDNWHSDVICARKQGFVPLFLPKAMEAFENKIQGVQTNGCAFLGEAAASGWIKQEALRQSVGFGCMLALTANRYFDNPFQSFHPESDLNVDPFLVGYYPLGMHLLGIVQWLGQQCRKRQAFDIYFLARDGYLVRQAYEIFGRGAQAPELHYLYASRKALLCAMIRSEQDFFCLPVVYSNHSPKSLLEMLTFAKKPEMTQKECRQVLADCGVDDEKRFASEEAYVQFIRLFISRMYSARQLEKSRELAAEYYAQIRENSIVFDMGYSGRIQAAVSSLLGRGVDVWFIHKDQEYSDRMQRIGDYHIQTLYAQVPKVSGLLREHLLSDDGPACTGFVRQDGTVREILEPERKRYQDLFVIDTIQKAALQFVTDFTETFQGFEAYVPYSCVDVSMPFEGYLSRIRGMDRKVYGASYFEDMVYGASRDINIEEFLNQMLPLAEGTQAFGPVQLSAKGKRKGKLRKGIGCFLSDKRRFRHLVWLKLKDHKVLYAFGKLAGRIYDKIFIQHKKI